MKNFLKTAITLLTILFLMMTVAGCNGIGGTDKTKPSEPSKTPESVITDVGLSGDGEKTGTQSEIEKLEKKLIALGLVKDKDYTISGSGNATVIKLTDAGKQKIENQIKAEEGKIEGKTVEIDFTNKNFGVLLKKGENNFFNIFKLSDYNINLEPLKIGDKVKISFKAKTIVPLKNANIEFFYEKEDQKIYLASENYKRIAENVKANDEFGCNNIEIINVKTDVSDTENLCLAIGCELADNYDWGGFESGTGFSDKGNYFELEAQFDGIHITLKDLPGEKRNVDSLGAIKVLGNPVSLSIEADIPDENNRENYSVRNNYIYPFVTNGQDVYVKVEGEIKKADKSKYWSEELLKIKAISSKNINDYVVGLEKYNNIRLDVSFDDVNFYSGVFITKLITENQK